MKGRLEVTGKMASQMKTICFSLFLIFPLTMAVQADAADGRKNVLFLVSDDLNSWLLGDANRYAGKVVAPNLRKFAGSGVNFARAYTASPVCSPSRTAFFSGVSPWKGLPASSRRPRRRPGWGRRPPG